MRTSSFKNSLLLFIAALIWGTAFVAQASGASYLPGFAFTAARSYVGALFLIPVAFISEKIAKRHESDYSKEGAEIAKRHMVGPFTRSELIGGTVCGIALALAANFQQIGLSYTTVAKSGFLTALYVIIVPIIGIFQRKRIHPIIWLSVALSVVGLYLLCLAGQEGLSLSFGDALEITCAFLFSIQIIAVAHYSPRCRGVFLSCVQFGVCGTISLLISLVFEQPGLNGLVLALPYVLYVGIFSSGIAYTLQILGQKDVDPTISSLIMCLESVISAISGWIVLGQSMTATELTGGAMMFAGIVLSQILPARLSKNQSASENV